MSDFGFIGDAYQSASIYQNDQELINWYPEIDARLSSGGGKGPPERGYMTLYPTPGLSLKKTSSTIGEVRGLYTASGGLSLFGVVGPNAYAYDQFFNETFLGTLSSNSGPVSITDNNVSVYITDGNNRYSFDTSTGFNQLASTDGAFTGGSRCDIIDNYIIYNRPGTQQWGCTNALSTVSSNLNFSSKDGSSDNLVAPIVSNREVFLLGERTGEVWTDVGAFPFPFSRLEGTSIQHGCISWSSIARLGESFAFLTQDDRGRNIVAMMVGYNPKRISNVAVESAFSKYPNVTDAIAYSYQQSGHEFYVLTFPSADVTWVYDISTEKWHKRAWRDSNNILHRHRGNCAAYFQGNIIVGDFQNGNLYKFDQSVFTDNGDMIPCIRRAPHIVKDYDRIFYQSLQLYFQPGVGIQSGQGSNPNAMLRWSDDGGSTFGNEHWTSIGKVGRYKNRAIWRQLGTARDRIFEVMVTDPVNRVLVSAELQASPGEY